GEKTGLKLLKQFDSIENVYENLDDVPGKKLKENLIENENMAYLSRKLGEIIVNVPVDREIEDLKVKMPEWEELVSLYEKYEFNSLLSKIPEEYITKEEEIKKEFKYEIIDKSIFENIISQ